MYFGHSLVRMGIPGFGAWKEGSNHPGWRKDAGSAGRARKWGQSMQINVMGCPGTLAGDAQP